MKRTLGIGQFSLVLVAVLALVVVAFGGQRMSQDRTGILRGTVVATSDRAIDVRDERGIVRSVAVDGTTLVMSDDEDFSIANLPDIRISVADLASGDLVEIVVQGERRAGIVTRLSPIDPTATARVAKRP